MQKTYNNKALLDYEAMLQLITAIKSGDNVEEDIELISQATNNFFHYVNTVDVTEQQIIVASCRFEGQEYREAISNYDTLRRNAHESAIANVSMLNKLAALYSIKPPFKGDLKDRLEVADFCLEVTVAVFNNRRI